MPAAKVHVYACQVFVLGVTASLVAGAPLQRDSCQAERRARVLGASLLRPSHETSQAAVSSESDGGEEDERTWRQEDLADLFPTFLIQAGKIKLAARDDETGTQSMIVAGVLVLLGAFILLCCLSVRSRRDGEQEQPNKGGPFLTAAALGEHEQAVGAGLPLGAPVFHGDGSGDGQQPGCLSESAEAADDVAELPRGDLTAAALRASNNAPRQSAHSRGGQGRSQRHAAGGAAASAPIFGGEQDEQYEQQRHQAGTASAPVAEDSDSASLGSSSGKDDDSISNSQQTDTFTSSINSSRMKAPAKKTKGMERMNTIDSLGGHRRNSADLLKGATNELMAKLARRHSASSETTDMGKRASSSSTADGTQQS